MILAKTNENNITNVQMDGSGMIITAELCAIVDAFGSGVSKNLGMPKSKAYEMILTQVANALAESLKKEKAAE